MRRYGMTTLTLLALLSGCATQSGGAPWTHWVCDGDIDLHWRPVEGAADQVEVRLEGTERVYLLHRQEAGSGAFYTDGQLAFHSKGKQGLVYWAQTDELIGRGCKAPGK